MVDQFECDFSGLNAIGDNCTSSSDCDYGKGRCLKRDQCEIGMCGCDYGYKVDGIGNGKFCQKCEFV